VEAQVADMPIDKPHAPEDETAYRGLADNGQAEQKIQSTDSKGNSDQPANKHILVIEDDEDAAELLQLFLSHLGHTVTTQYSGAEALQAAENQRFDHILMDLTLPDYNGYDLASELKQKLPDAILTIVSGHEADSEAMTTIGINSALLKPVTKDDLASVVG
jgi:CheY-like chemotaxis protein